MHGILHTNEFGESGLEDKDIDAYRFLTLQIRGAEGTTQSDVVELLQRVGDSLLFQIDLSLELPLMLKRERNFQHHRHSHKHVRAAGSLPSLRYEYDRAPMSLYCMGKQLQRCRCSNSWLTTK